MSFDHLNLLPILLKNIRGAGYQTPTPIQEATIPLVLAGKDVLGCAQTGTGKTASFALPILQRLTEVPSSRRDARVIRSLILSPTRELALQTWENFQIYGKGLPLQSCVIFGGVGQGAQVEALHRGADIVIACPGRLLDLMAQGFVRLEARADEENVQILVEDDGVGIPDSEKAHIFERFYRVDKARSRKAGGAGLGLSIVQDMVTRNDGIIFVEDRPEGGSRFRLSFPYFAMPEEDTP